MKHSKKHRLRPAIQGRPNKAAQTQPPSARARRLQNLRVLPPHNSNRNHPTQASQGDEVAGSKLAGPEGACSERAQPVLIHRESLFDSREAAQHQQNAPQTANPFSFSPSCSFVPSCFKKNSLCVLCALCGPFFLRAYS